jgi:hypothetical protein
MYKQLMTLLTVATLACGFAFAEDETTPVQPIAEEVEQTEEASLAGCGCDKPGCGCGSVAVEQTDEDEIEETLLAGCGCGKKEDNEKDASCPKKKDTKDLACSKCRGDTVILCADETTEEETKEPKLIVELTKEESLAAGCGCGKKKNDKKEDEVKVA